MMWLSIGIAIAALGVMAWGIYLWAGNHEFWSTVLIFGGACMLLWGATKILPLSEATGEDWNWYISIMSQLGLWWWLVFIVVGLLLTLDGGLNLHPDIQVDHNGIPHRAPGTGVQVQGAAFGLIVGSVVTIIGLFGAVQDLRYPDTDPMYHRLYDATRNYKKIEVQLAPLTIFQEDITEADKERWKQLLIDGAKARNGDTLTDTTIHEVRWTSSDKFTIDQFVIIFSATNDLADPIEDQSLEYCAFNIPSDWDYEKTKTEVEKLIARYTPMASSTRRRNGAIAAANGGTTPSTSRNVIEPPQFSPYPCGR